MSLAFREKGISYKHHLTTRQKKSRSCKEFGGEKKQNKKEKNLTGIKEKSIKFL